MIEAVLFDGDQTLWDFERVMREALIAVAGELRAARPGPFTDALRWEDLERDRAGGRRGAGTASSGRWPRLRVHGFARTLQRRRAAEGGDEAADEALADELSDVVLRTTATVTPRSSPTRSPASTPCVADYRLGLLSNGSRLPETVGLARYFESVVFAQDHRVAKPDKGIFEVVERELGVGPEACVLVGDHPVNDVAGAKRAGWRAVWIDRDGDGDFEPIRAATTKEGNASRRRDHVTPATLPDVAQGRLAVQRVRITTPALAPRPTCGRARPGRPRPGAARTRPAAGAPARPPGRGRRRRAARPWRAARRSG